MGERTGTLAPLIYYRMDVHTLSTFLSPILTVASVWNTGETGEINVTVWLGQASSVPNLSAV